MDFHIFSLIFIDFHGFSKIREVLGPECRTSCELLWRPVASCGPLKSPVAAEWIPLISKFKMLEAWIWRPGAWMSGCWKDWNGLGEVTEVTALWGEGIGRNSHTLELQEFGGVMDGVSFRRLTQPHYWLSKQPCVG